MVLSIDELPIDIIIQTIKFIKQLAKNWCFHEKGFIEIINLLRGKMFECFLVNILLILFAT